MMMSVRIVCISVQRLCWDLNISDGLQEDGFDPGAFFFFASKTLVVVKLIPPYCHQGISGGPQAGLRVR